MDVNGGSEISKPNSNFRLDDYIHFCINALWNPFLLLQPTMG